MSQDEYFADRADWGDERARLEILGALYDENSQCHLRKTGISTGWNCLEVGAGGGSMTRWLSAKVGSSGQVVALDLNCRFLRALSLANVEVREADILEEEIEVEHYDLLYSRFMLQHIPERTVALDKMLGAVKPGGWVVLEDPDFSSMRAVDENDIRAESFNTWIEKGCDYLAGTNRIDVYFGRRLPALLNNSGLQDVQNEGTTSVHVGGDLAGDFYSRTFELNREAFVRDGVFTTEECEEQRQLLLDPSFSFTDLTMFAAWGRKRVG